MAVKMHLCGQARAKDANIRQALIDRFGGAAAIGRKAAPGPLYGISGDVWQALGLAVTWWDRREQEANVTQSFFSRWEKVIKETQLRREGP